MSVGAVNKQTGDRIPTAGMPAIDDALDLTSVNPVQNAIITAALANKQDKTDNSLQTTDKTVVGAINEHEGDIDSLRSGLTNVDVALSVPDGSGKNLLATQNGEYEFSDVTYTINNTAIQVVGTASANSYYAIYGWTQLKDTFLASYAGKKVKISSTSDDVRFTLAYRQNSSSTASEYHVFNGEAELTLPSDTTYQIYLAFKVASGVSVNTVIYPMIRLASITDSTFAPYIPSVESRIEAVESGLVNVLTDVSANTHLNKDSNLDTLPLGLYGINTYEGSGTGTGIPTYNTVGILWHIKGASNSFIQYIFGYNYFACRNRSNTTNAWEAWKFVHNALPT